MVDRAHTKRPAHSVHEKMNFVIGLSCWHVEPVLKFDDRGVGQKSNQFELRKSQQLQQQCQQNEGLSVILEYDQLSSHVTLLALFLQRHYVYFAHVTQH